MLVHENIASFVRQPEVVHLSYVIGVPRCWSKTSYSRNECFVAIDATVCSPQCRTDPSGNSSQPRERLL